MNTIRVVAALLCIAVGGSGCATHKRRYMDQQMDFGSIQQIAVLPLANLSREPAAAERVRDVFSSALLATKAAYVVPPGEVARALSRAGIAPGASLTSEDVIKVAQTLKVQALVTGVVKEYGEIRGTGASTGNIISVSMQLAEATTGKIVWSASTTQGGISLGNRLLGTGGAPMNDVTDKAVDDLIDQLFR